jgi:hypothetical protein
MTTILAPASLFSLGASLKAQIQVGSHEAEAMRLWDPAPSHRRDLMLAAILIFDGTYRDELLRKQWTQLPPEIQSSVAGTLAEIRSQDKMYIGYLD